MKVSREGKLAVLKLDAAEVDRMLRCLGGGSSPCLWCHGCPDHDDGCVVPQLGVLAVGLHLRVRRPD